MANKKSRLQQPRRKTTQTNLDLSSISPKQGPVYPRTQLVPFNSTEEKELHALYRLFPSDAANPYKELYNLNFEFCPRLRICEPQYEAFLPLLYNEMSDADTYIAIQDLLNITFRLKHIDPRLSICHTGVGRFLYTPM